MADGDACTPCAPSANDNYTVHTFELYVCYPSGREYAVGNVMAGGFRGSHNLLDHFAGVSGRLDARVILQRTLEIYGTLDEITSRNLALIMNTDFVNVAGACRVPLESGTTLREYGARLEHTFPNGEKTLTIQFWSANIVGDFDLAFSDTWASVEVVIGALDCEELHPTEPFGYIEINETCPPS